MIFNFCHVLNFDIENAPRDARKLNHEYKLSDEERQLIFDYLNTHEKLSEKELLKIVGLSQSDGFKSDKAIKKGIQGNDTRFKISKALGDFPEKEALLKFDLIEETVLDPNGEELKIISPVCFQEPLYQLWHTLYSISDKEELFTVLCNKFGINDPDVLERLYALDFVKDGYANKSAKMMRKLIPQLKEGAKYSDACAAIGINHSANTTKDENETRELKEKIPQILKGELRQPVVEKILNQMINVVNAIIDEYGSIDEVRVELARELKRDKEGRQKMTENINKQERENKVLSQEIADLNITPTRRRIQKMRMLKETDNKCMYCGQGITPYQFIEGHGYDIEHIIPRSKLFDDSFSNKVCACRECNAAKGSKTAYDFMLGRGENELNKYLDRVDELFKNGKISKVKRDRLKMSESEIPCDFISRDLRESQYISKKSLEILRQVIRNVYASSGNVTSFFRHVWGYDTILHDLNFPKYDEAGLTEIVEYETHGQKHQAKAIKDWSKRKDHRHHALDALVVALTRQGYIQRLNTLNALGKEGTDNQWKGLDKWAAEQPHFERGEVMDALDEVSTSFKAGKKLTTPGKRYERHNGKRVCVQDGLLIPRSPLHKETIYGIIKVDDGVKKIKYALDNLDLIQIPAIRELLVTRMAEFNGDRDLTLKSLKKRPLVFAGKEINSIKCYRKETVARYKIGAICYKDLRYIVDAKIRKIIADRFDEVGNNDKAFEKSLAERPLYSDATKKAEIKTVRILTNLKIDTLAGVRKDGTGKQIGFAQTQNNHHIAFYRNQEGSIEGSVVSFWDCVNRKKLGLPAIIKNPDEAWDILESNNNDEVVETVSRTMPTPDSKFITSLQQNEMVVMGMSDEEWRDAVNARDFSEINRHLYRVWKLSAKQYCFKYHTNTTAAILDGDKELKQFYIIASIPALMNLHPRKVKVSLLGKLQISEDDKENSMF